MAKVRNFLFIMCDQLRADYLSCYGHPSLETPHIDALAARGVKFERAYCQSPVCGASRASTYTGRYVTSHGGTYNNVPFPVSELTLGDYMRAEGLRCGLVGKTHMVPDVQGMKRLGIDPATDMGILLSQCGFDPVERDDGLHPTGFADPDLAYNNYLRAKGYDGENPWHDFANSAEGPGGEVLSGWEMRHAHLPARVRAEDSETPYMTRRAMEYITEAGDNPWCLHLSYIKPHWPYVAPAPYHDMYGPNNILPAKRNEAERQDIHPVVAAFMAQEDSETFHREEVRQRVIPAYMGLIKQLDDAIGELMSFLDDKGRLDDTMIVFTSDHGDYLGDHWLGEKDLFHEASARIPLIVCDPDAAADATRGRSEPRLAEAIDIIPTFLDALGAEAPSNKLEGRSLLPLTRDGGAGLPWRDAAFSEIEYGLREARLILDLEPQQCRAFMVRNERYKYVHFEGFRPQLFDLEQDPDELADLGQDPAHAGVRAEMHERLFLWLRTRPIRYTMSEEDIAKRTATHKTRGFYFGVW